MSITARPHRAGLVALLGTLVLLTGLIAPPAQADYQVRKTKSFTQGYVGTVMTRFYTPNMCVRTRLAGVIKFRGTYIAEHRTTSQPGTTAYGYAIDNVRLETNSMVMDTFKPNGSACTTTRKNYVRLTATEKWRGYACTYNPSISVSAGAGLSIGVAGWPTCGSKTLAKWSATDYNGGNHFEANNSEGVVYFNSAQNKGWYASKQTGLTWKCYGVAATLKPTTGTATDTKTIDTSRIKICPTWSGSLTGF